MGFTLGFTFLQQQAPPHGQGLFTFLPMDGRQRTTTRCGKCPPTKTKYIPEGRPADWSADPRPSRTCRPCSSRSTQPCSCAPSEVLSTDCPTNGFWQLNDAAGNNLFSGFAGEAGTWCLAAGDYTFIGSDSYGDGWDGENASFTWNGLTTEVTVATDVASIVLAVSADIPGCTDPAASNYDEGATVDDGSCCLDNLITINTFDSFGDGWSFASGGAHWPQIWKTRP